MSEPTITVNGRILTTGQAMTLRVALGHFLRDIRQDGLGDDETGKNIAQGYINRGSEVLEMMADE